MKPSTQLLRCFGVPIMRGKPRTYKETGGVTASVEADDGLSIALREASAWPTTYFDTETSVRMHSGQRFRFGYFQDRRPSYDECAEEWARKTAVSSKAVPPRSGADRPGTALREAGDEGRCGELSQEFLDRLWRDGVFYDPKSPDVSKADVATLQAYAKRVNDERVAEAVVDYNKTLGDMKTRLDELNSEREDDEDDDYELQQLEFDIEFMESCEPTRPPKFLCLEIDEFIDRVFYHRKFKKYADNTREDHLIVGHHLPFDLGAVSSHSGAAIEELFGGVSMSVRPGSS